MKYNATHKPAQEHFTQAIRHLVDLKGLEPESEKFEAVKEQFFSATAKIRKDEKAEKILDQIKTNC